MARYRTQGYEDARDAGLLAGSPDLRVAIAMSGFTFDEDAIHLDDGTLDEYDGANYVRYDAADVAADWDAVTHQRVWTCTSGGGDEFGTSVGAATDTPTVLVVILRVDGTAANDYILGWTDDVALSNGNGSDMGLTLPNDVLLFSGNAA